MSQVPEPTLDLDDAKLYERGIEEFNAGYYFECHETLEDVWNGVRGPARDFFQGLIQVSVACYHLTNGNAAGALSLLDRARTRLAKYPDRYGGIELGRLREETAALYSVVRDGSLTSADAHILPKYHRLRRDPL